MIGYQDKINQILRGAETIKNMNDDTDLELSVSVLTKTLEKVQLERDALWVKTQEDEREINQLMDSNKERLIQRTELLEIAEEMADVIIGNGASVKDAIPIDKLDEFYKKWNIGEPFVRDYSA
jgi:hypothetical protein